MTVRIGSLFSGIGGFEVGLERAIPGTETVWQVEADAFCQSILQKHWPQAVIYDDVCAVGSHNLEPVDILCGGFPCQDISIVGKQRGINDGKKSSLYYEMFRIICEIRPRVVIFENVPAIIRLGGHDVLKTLASAGYDAEWCTIRTAADFGLPHIRRRWFCVAYDATYTHGIRYKTGKNHTVRPSSHRTGQSSATTCSSFEKRRPGHDRGRGDETTRTIKPIICRSDDGVSDRLDKTTVTEHNRRLKALGNAITPPASEWIGQQVLQSGLLDDLL